MIERIRENQFSQLILAHLKETIREPGVLFWGIIFPILMSLGLGIAFTQKSDSIRKVAIIDDSTRVQLPVGKKLLISDFLKNNQAKNVIDPHYKNCRQITIRDDKLGNLSVLFLTMAWEEAMVKLKQGELNLVLMEKNGQLEYHFDPLNPDAQLTYLKLSKFISRPGTQVSENTDMIVPMTLKGTRYIDFLIPGLMAMGVMMSSMWGISYNIIDKRSKKLLRRMVATPMKKTAFLSALITVRTGMNFIESVLLFIFAALVFHISIQGSIPALFLIFIAGNIAFAGLAVFISSHTRNTEVGNGLINVVVMPMMILSGIFFSYHNFPDWSITVIKNMPLTMLADGIRSIFTEGAGLTQIAIPAMILSGGGIILFIAGLKMFRWH
ncbi:MAG: ABC transporter permease [Bacteroidia bacterium]|nr:ABC transporter permease [Bacteroidia bacterium]